MEILKLVLILALLIGVPAVCMWAIVDHVKHGKDRPRRGGGGAAGAFMELDRLAARPSVEHVIEARNPVLRREDDDGDDNAPRAKPDGTSP